VEESETDDDADAADNTVDYQAIRRVREITRREIDKHIAKRAPNAAKWALSFGGLQLTFIDRRKRNTDLSGSNSRTEPS
jgi:hypothetical protein